MNDDAQQWLRQYSKRIELLDQEGAFDRVRNQFAQIRVHPDKVRCVPGALFLSVQDH